MRIVLDTNVFVSGIFWNGSPSKILAMWAERRFDLFVTPEILGEYTDVVHRLSSNTSLSDQWILFVESHASIVRSRSRVTLSRDNADNKFLECAMSARADFLITGDRDLLELQEIFPIPIVIPAGFLKSVKNLK